MTPVAGVLVLNKPQGFSSHQAVQAVKRLVGAEKAGHTGTLDPFARGVLPVLLGRATKAAQFLQGESKRYRATVCLGRATETLDPTGRTIEERPVPPLVEARVTEVLAGFRGEREQVPPMFSAKKVAGRPLYKAARRGETVEREAKRVVVHDMQLVAMSGESVTIDVHCGPGTYVRVLAAEIAEALGTVGHLAELTRLACGNLVLEDALDLEEIERLAAQGALPSRIVPLDRALAGFPRVVLREAAVRRLLLGGAVSVADAETEAALAPGQRLRLAAPDGHLVALAQAVCRDGGPLRLVPLRVLDHP